MPSEILILTNYKNQFQGQHQLIFKYCNYFSYQTGKQFNKFILTCMRNIHYKYTVYNNI